MRRGVTLAAASDPREGRAQGPQRPAAKQGGPRRRSAKLNRRALQGGRPSPLWWCSTAAGYIFHGRVKAPGRRPPAKAGWRSSEDTPWSEKGTAAGKSRPPALRDPAIGGRRWRRPDRESWSASNRVRQGGEGPAGASASPPWSSSATARGRVGFGAGQGARSPRGDPQGDRGRPKARAWLRVPLREGRNACIMTSTAHYGAGRVCAAHRAGRHRDHRRRGRMRRDLRGAWCAGRGRQVGRHVQPHTT